MDSPFKQSVLGYFLDPESVLSSSIMHH